MVYKEWVRQKKKRNRIFIRPLVKGIPGIAAIQVHGVIVKIILYQPSVTLPLLMMRGWVVIW